MFSKQTLGGGLLLNTNRTITFRPCAFYFGAKTRGSPIYADERKPSVARRRFFIERCTKLTKRRENRYQSRSNAYRRLRRGAAVHGCLDRCGLRAAADLVRGRRGVRPGLGGRRVHVLFGVRGVADRSRRHRRTGRRRCDDGGRRRFRRGARLVTSGYITRV